MKITAFLLFVFPFLAFSQGKDANGLTADGLKKYPIERGRISYEISGDASGTEEMTFEQFGWKSLRRQTMTFELYGIESKQSIHEITDGDFVFRLSPNDSTFAKRQDLKWSQQAAYKTPEEASEAILFSLGGTQTSEGTVMDKTCQVWTFENKSLQELWVWNGLVLKRKLKLGDRLVESTAVSFDDQFAADPTLFEIPGYYQEKN